MSGHNKTTLTIAENGPYIVKGLKSLRGKDGDMPSKPTMALCRCGGSSNKPFCDGTHANNGFSGENIADPSQDKRTDYRGAALTIEDNRSICAHAGICTDRLPSVFRLRKEPWIHPDAASPEEIIALVKACPSGALSVSMDTSGAKPAPSEPSIAVAPGGPYVVSGGVDISGVTRAKGATNGKYTLCRCGASKNKPFCDGTHWNVKFDEPLRATNG